MSNISTYVVYTGNGESKLVDWVEGHKYRHCPSFDAITLLKQIARTRDEDARQLMMSLFGTCEHFKEVVDEMHKEFDTLGVALRKIADDETADDQVGT